jgi:integrase
MTVLTPAQARTLLAAAAGDRLEALYMLALTTGMRQGELLALTWANVDLDTGALMVTATVQYAAGGGFTFLPPKTKRSRRKIALPAAAVAALRKHKARQISERARVGSAWDDLDLVFPNACGRPLDGTNVLRQQLQPLLRRAGLPPIRFHDLRHTAATLPLRKGVNPKIVSELLGHSSVSITLDIYSHVLPDMQEQAAAAMDEALGDDTRQQR